ncbi:MAG: PEP-CTERM sorting domain-containing protein [Verrucomicrobiaceae bacterium]|nr:MAG: PEP-CTERM sorting domain-containing protein [Verrucomicrobiaceae bacterium]
MKTSRYLTIASCLLSLSNAYGAISYEDLDHINSTYLNNVKAVNKNIGYANFEGTNSSLVPFMITVFFDIDTVLTTTLMEHDWGSNLYSQYTGAFGVYVYNMQTNTVALAPVFTSSITTSQNILALTEYQGNTGLYQDQFDFSVGTSNFNYSDANDGDGIDTTSSFSTALGNTIGTAGFPFPVVGTANFAYSPTGPSWSADAINGNLHSTGVLAAVPEPSAVLMLGAAGCLTLAKRRRKVA